MDPIRADCQRLSQLSEALPNLFRELAVYVSAQDKKGKKDVGRRIVIILDEIETGWKEISKAIK